MPASAVASQRNVAAVDTQFLGILPDNVGPDSASLCAAGKMCSGARRYCTAMTRQPLYRASCLSWLSCGKSAADKAAAVIIDNAGEILCRPAAKLRETSWHRVQYLQPVRGFQCLRRDRAGDVACSPVINILLARRRASRRDKCLNQLCNPAFQCHFHISLSVWIYRFITG